MNADGTVVIEINADNKKAEKELNRLSNKINSLEQKLSEKQGKQNSIKAELDDAMASALQTTDQVEKLKRELEQVKNVTTGQVSADPTQYLAQLQRQDQITAELKEQEALLRQQDKEAQKLGTQYAKITDEVNQQSAELNKAKERAGDIQKQLVSASGPAEMMASAMERVQKSTGRFSARLREVIRSALVFTAISQGMAELRTWLGQVVKANDQASEAIGRLKGALLTLAQPIVNIIVPAFTEFVNLLSAIVTRVAGFVSGLFGSTIEGSSSAAENLYNEAQAIEETGSAAKKASKSLAGFDQINKLSSGENSNGGGASNQEGGAITPNFDPSFVQDGIDQVMGILSGSLLAIGAVLTFSGANIPLGIGLMSVGAILLGSEIAANWAAISLMLQGPIGAIALILGGALLVLGAILTFSGANVPLGLGLMIAGASGMAMTVAANWEAMNSTLQGPIGVLIGVLSAAVLVIGAILVFSGANIPMGIGLMIAGAAGLGSIVAINWETISTALQGPIGAVAMMVSLAVLAIGAILTFSGANIPLGIGLMILGTAGLATIAAVNWESVQTALEGPVGAVVGIVSAALLAIGAILTFSGANIPLGIGMLILGAAGLATSVAANWETIQTTLEGPIGLVVGMVSAALLALGAILVFSGAAPPLGIGLLILGASGLAMTVAANWETLTNLLQGPIGAITALVSAALLVLGVILIFTGAAIPLGLGLLIAGASGLATSVAPNWGFLLDAAKNAWRDIQNWWNTNVADFFTIEFWTDLGEDILNGFFDGLKNIWDGITSWVSDGIDWIKNAFSGAKASVSAEYSTDTNSAAGRAAYASGNQISEAARYLSNNIPRLARGAVIPPNREFLAVLGDQRSGYNYEVPDDKLRQLIREETAGLREAKEIRLVVTAGDSLVRELKIRLDRESQRQGVSLVKGGVL